MTKYPRSPLAVAARLRVAQLKLRKGDAAGALTALQPPPAPTAEEQRRSSRAHRWFGRRAPEVSLQFDSEQYLFETRRLRELIQHNADDPQYGAAPLQALACLDPHREGYRVQLARLAEQYGASRLYDNLLVRWVSTQADREAHIAQLTALIALLPGAPDEDALPEALFQLADLEVQTPAPGNERRRETGIARFREIIRRFPDTCWAAVAADRLNMFVPATEAATKPAASGIP